MVDYMLSYLHTYTPLLQLMFTRRTGTSILDKTLLIGYITNGMKLDARLKPMASARRNKRQATASPPPPSRLLCLGIKAWHKARKKIIFCNS